MIQKERTCISKDVLSDLLLQFLKSFLYVLFYVFFWNIIWFYFELRRTRLISGDKTFFIAYLALLQSHKLNNPIFLLNWYDYLSIKSNSYSIYIVLVCMKIRFIFFEDNWFSIWIKLLYGKIHLIRELDNENWWLLWRIVVVWQRITLSSLCKFESSWNIA